MLLGFLQFAPETKWVINDNLLSNSQPYVHKSTDVWGYRFRTSIGAILGRAESDHSAPVIHSSTSIFFLSLCKDRRIWSKLTYTWRELSLPSLWISVKSFSNLSYFTLREILSSFLLEAYGQNQSAWHCTVSVGDRQEWLRACLISKNAFPRSNG